MSTMLPRRIRTLINDKSIGHLAVATADGPHVSPVWLDCADGLVLINTSEGKVKVRTVRRDPRVAISVTHPQDPYKRVTIFGQVVEMRHRGAREHLDKLAAKYLAVDRHPNPGPGRRVILVIEPMRLSEANISDDGER